MPDEELTTLLFDVQRAAVSVTKAARRIKASFGRPAPTKPAVPVGEDERFGRPLTPRELEVIALVALGYTNLMIAQELGTARKTTIHQVTSICRKLGAANRTAAAVKAMELGYLKERHEA